MPAQQAMSDPKPNVAPRPKAASAINPAVRQNVQTAKTALKLGVNASTVATAHKKLSDIYSKTPNITYAQALRKLPPNQAQQYNAFTSEVPSDQLNANSATFRRITGALKTAKNMRIAADKAAQKAAQAAAKTANESVEFLDKEQVTEMLSAGQEKTPPMMMVLRRKAIRVFPDGHRVALYENKQYGLVFTVPYKGEGFTPQDLPNVTSEGFDDYEQEAAPSEKEVKMAKGIAYGNRYKGGNMTAAVDAIEKIRPGLSNHPDVKTALRTANEEIQHIQENPALLAVAGRIGLAGRLGATSRAGGIVDKIKKVAQVADTASSVKKAISPPKDELDEGLGDIIQNAKQGLKKTQVNWQSTHRAAYGADPTKTSMAIHAIARLAGVKPGEARGIGAILGGKKVTAQQRQAAAGRVGKKAILKMRNEETEQVTENLDALAKIAKENKAGTIKFKDGSSTKVHPQVAGIVHQLHGALNPENKKKVENMISHSAGHFDKIADFAVSKSQWTINNK